MAGAWLAKAWMWLSATSTFPIQPLFPLPHHFSVSPANLLLHPGSGELSDALTHPSPKILLPPSGPPQPPVPAPAGLFPCSGSGVAPNSPPNPPAKKRGGPEPLQDPSG